MRNIQIGDRLIVLRDIIWIIVGMVILLFLVVGLYVVFETLSFMGSSDPIDDVMTPWIADQIAP